MNRSLTLALLDFSPGWELLLEQIGAPYRVVHNVNDLSPERTAVVIVNRHLWKEEEEALDDYVRRGGGVLDVGRFLPGGEPSRFRRGRAGSLFADPKSLLLSNSSVLDLHCRTLQLRGEGEFNGLVGLEHRGEGVIGFLGFDPGRLLLNNRAVTKRFPGLPGYYPAERVSQISKGELQKFCRRLLIRLYGRLGLPFLRRRSFPDDAPNILCFRIDSDYGSREQIDALYDVACRTGTAMTWFLHVEGHAEWLGRFREFSGQEIALHCMRHRTFPGFEENRANIADGLAALRQAGIEVQGFAAPNGIWNHALARAVDEQRFLYSSEFALACDTLPFRPILPLKERVNRRFYQALQIPIHPVSIGNLMRLRMTETQMVDYYRAVMEQKMNEEDPLIFYHHPTHERWGVMEELLREGHRHGVRNLTFAEFARWWVLREKAVVEGTFGNGVLTVRSHHRDPSVWLEVILPDGRKGTIREDGMIATDRFAAPEPFQGNGYLESPAAIRAFSWKLKRRILHDWVIRTSR